MAGFGDAAVGGAVDIISDGGVSRSFTAIAREVISGGQFVTVSGAANVIGSEASTRSPGSIVAALISGTLVTQVVGIAAANTGSNEILTVNTRGIYIATAAGVISGGMAVQPVAGTVQGVQFTSQEHSSGTHIGRALLPSASGTNLFTLVNFNF